MVASRRNGLVIGHLFWHWLLVICDAMFYYKSIQHPMYIYIYKTLYHVCMPTSGHRTVCDSHETNDAPVLVKPAVKQQHPQRSVAIARGTEVVYRWFLNLSLVTGTW